MQRLSFKRLGDYTVGKKLGAGKFSTVRLAVKDGKQYAIKIIKKAALQSE